MVGKAAGIAIGVGLMAWAVYGSSVSAEEKDAGVAATEKIECSYQGVSYEPGALECWNDGYWHRCDGKTGRWINMRQKCKLT